MKQTPRHILYDALLNRDARYDGLLFFGVTTTGIYCRPVCPAPKPKFENTLYFSDALTPQLAGFRACKRCRPESRPGSPAWQGTKTTISRALRLLAQNNGPSSLSALADTLGISSRHLRRLFQNHLGKSPMAVKTEHRTKLAMALLAKDNSSMTDIAFAAGWTSLRRFNAAFKKATGTSPSQWRANRHASISSK